ncbi:MAG: sensor histidine kinase [Clostridia bacterium]|nr:sensor histidine kinase [Clostridia bacterium]
MVTKLRNNKLIYRYFSIVILFVSLFSFRMSFIYATHVMNDTYYSTSQSYFNTREFKNKAYYFLREAIAFHYEYRNYPIKTNLEKVSEDQVQSEMKRNKSIYQSEISVANATYNQSVTNMEINNNTTNIQKLKKELESDLQYDLERIKKKYLKSKEEVRKQLVTEKDTIYNNLRNYLTQSTFLKYYIINMTTGETYTNLDQNVKITDYMKNSTLFWEKLPNKDDQYLTYDKSFFDHFQDEAYILVPKTSKGFNPYEEEAKKFEAGKREFQYQLLLALALFLIPLILLLSLRVFSHPLLESLLNIYFKVPLDLKLAVFILYGLLLLDIQYTRLSFADTAHFLFINAIFTLFILYLIITIKYVVRLFTLSGSFVHQIKKSLLFISIRYILRLFKNVSLFKRILLALILLILLTTILSFSIIIVSDTDGLPFLIGLSYILFYFVVIPFYTLREAAYLNEIIKRTKEVTAGNLDFELKEKRISTLSILAQNINNIKNGFKKAVDSQIRSERLKSELITNVSHDLKTPLTSIVNYVNLLKTKDLTPEEMKNYIEILDRKSQRLKTLIEDLFDASKMTSGAVELAYENIDIVALLKQALGEFDEKIKSSSLIFKVYLPKQGVYLYLDGKKTWRVFENLISNILNYSQANTRVYIDLLEEDQQVILTMKNISAYEMGFSPDEIFERFKRGDQSRHTEGSGLGLAIARSIVELQNGKLHIELDGDLFKVIIKFNKK